MSPRFPQEIFDLIIDQYPLKTYLTTYSLVCKRWSIRCRSYLFESIRLNRRNWQRWTEIIPPTPDGPSQYVSQIYIFAGVVPIVPDPQPLDSYINHFSAFTRVVDLTLVDHRGMPIHFDMLFQCFSAFKNTLRSLTLGQNSYTFNEMSRIVEFFPNLEQLTIWAPIRPKEESFSFPPLQKASFPKLKDLSFFATTGFPDMCDHLMSGFGQASMNLQTISLTGKPYKAAAVQPLLDSSADSLVYLVVPPLELDVSRCKKLIGIEVRDVLHTYLTHYLRDPPEKPRFEQMLRTVDSPELLAISVQCTSGWCLKMRGIDDEDEEDEKDHLPKNDWSLVDELLCDVLARGRVKDPTWSFWIRITNYRLNSYGEVQFVDLESFLPGFQARGGTVFFTREWR